jgi:peptidoglycan/LPS O-acetylase OafA/YrhL
MVDLAYNASFALFGHSRLQAIFMGSIRALLAISVLITHSDPIFGIQLMNGDMAITCFFMISGFLMGLILETKYHHIGPFYLNRILRIYPAYLMALLFTAVVLGLMGSKDHDPFKLWGWLWESGDWLGMMYTALANVALLGIDLSRYVGVMDHGNVVFPAFLFPESNGGHNLLLVPQAWTLALELEFYLIAPFVVRLRTFWLILLTLGLAMASVVAQSLLRGTLDLAAVFPAQVHFFLFGVLAWRGYRVLQAHPKALGSARPLVTWGMVGLSLAFVIFAYRIQQHQNSLGQLVVYGVFAATIPFLFTVSRRSNLDKWIGEFSYPIYLFHFGVVQFLNWIVPRAWSGESTLLLTLALCALYILVIDRPLQARRARIANRDAGARTSSMAPQIFLETGPPEQGRPPQ